MLSALVADALDRPAVRVSARDFQRPAGERFQHGRQDAMSFRDRWTDVGALRREVLDRFPTGTVLPALRDPGTDRSVRAAPLRLSDEGVLLVDGLFLLGLGLPAELQVHVSLSPGALLRWGAEPWQLEAFASYDEEVAPGDAADVLVRWDDPRRPAVRSGTG